MKIQQQLVRQLADGKVHSGQALAVKLGVSRAAVWKQVKQLENLGLEVTGQPGTGYSLMVPMDLLQADRIRDELNAATRDSLDALDVMWSIRSTSDYLLDQDSPEPGRIRVCLAEAQTGGRGRRGRRWLSPFGGGIYLSQTWCFAEAPPELSALSLAAGVGVLRALESAGAQEIRLKWPNDVVAAGKKLAGILVDVRGESEGPLVAVLGVGVNLDVPEQMAAAIVDEGGMAPTGLSRVISDGRVSRNRLAALFINELFRAMQDFSEAGFSRFTDEWAAHDFLRDRQVSVQIGDRVRLGIARGTAPDGRLRLESQGVVESFVSGEVTLRE